MNKLQSFLGACVVSLFAVQAAAAQAPTREQRAEALDLLAERMDHYVRRDVKPAVVRKLRERRAEYLALEEPDAFTKAVTADLYAASGDKHLQLWLEPPPREEAAAPPPEEAERMLGYGIGSVRRLPGGVGYLKLNHFSGAPKAAEAVDRAMALLSVNDALIIDLRRNGGGGEAALRRLVSHFFAKPVELVTIDWRVCGKGPRPEDCPQEGAPKSERRWSDTLPGGPQFVGKPVYVLTSSDSFSAAEEFAYDLQQEGRATLVGETTGGGANPSAMMGLGRFAVVMPIGLTRHPKSNGNWDGVGVKPDVAVKREQALTEAYRLALTELQKKQPESWLHGERANAATDAEKTLREEGEL